LTSLTALSEGILANYTDREALLAAQDVRWSWLLLVPVVAGPAVYLLLLGVKVRRARLSSDVALARRRKAWRQAQRGLREAAALPDARELTEAVAEAVLGYMADRCNRPDGAITRDEAVMALHEAAVSEDVIGRIDRLLESCELSQYAGLDHTGAELRDEALSCLKELERCRF
jgi:hypothetical protein